jgi:hypothetical protein
MKQHCLNCGQEYEAQRKSSKYCSDSCRVQYYHKRQSGQLIIPKGVTRKEVSALQPLRGDGSKIIVDVPHASKDQQLNPTYEMHYDLYGGILDHIENLREKRQMCLEKYHETLRKDFGLDKGLIAGILGGIVGYQVAGQENRWLGAAVGLGLLGLGGYIYGIADGENRLPQILEALRMEIGDLDNQLNQMEIQKANQIRTLESIPKFIPMPEQKQQEFNDAGLRKVFFPQEARVGASAQTGTQIPVVSATQLAQKTFEVIPFEEPYRSLIGEPPFGFHGIIYGLPGQGKSTFAIQFANYLAGKHGRVLYVSAEEGHEKSLVDKINQQHRLSTMLDIADVSDKERASHLIKTSYYPFIFVDSADRLHLSAKDIQDLRQNTKSSLIFIHQTTKSGELKGEQELKHDADFVIQVSEYHATTVQEKNRYGGHSTLLINPLA